MKINIRGEMTEAAFQASIVKLLSFSHGWEYYHTHYSKRSNPGFPDLVMWNDYKGIGPFFRELKKQSGVVSPDQKKVMTSLYQAGCDVQVWRPSDWPEIDDLILSFVSQPQGTPLRI